MWNERQHIYNLIIRKNQLGNPKFYAYQEITMRLCYTEKEKEIFYFTFIPKTMNELQAWECEFVEEISDKTKVVKPIKEIIAFNESDESPMYLKYINNNNIDVFDSGVPEKYKKRAKAWIKKVEIEAKNYNWPQTCQYRKNIIDKKLIDGYPVRICMDLESEYSRVSKQYDFFYYKYIDVKRMEGWRSIGRVRENANIKHTMDAYVAEFGKNYVLHACLRRDCDLGAHYYWSLAISPVTLDISQEELQVEFRNINGIPSYRYFHSYCGITKYSKWQETGDERLLENNKIEPAFPNAPGNNGKHRTTEKWQQYTNYAKNKKRLEWDKAKIEKGEFVITTYESYNYDDDDDKPNDVIVIILVNEYMVDEIAEYTFKKESLEDPKLIEQWIKKYKAIVEEKTIKKELPLTWIKERKYTTK